MFCRVVTLNSNSSRTTKHRRRPGVFTICFLGLVSVAAGVTSADGQVAGPQKATTKPVALAESGSPAQADAAPAAPMIQFDKTTQDFGEHWAGPDLKCTFTFHNRGNAPLKITGINAGCPSCTVIGDYPKEIQPGESGTIPLTLKTEYLRGKASRVVTVTSNDPAKPAVSLIMGGEFRRRIEVNPVGAFFGPLLGDEPAVRTIKLKNNTGQKLELMLTPNTSEHFRFKLVETDPGNEYELHVTTIPPYKKGDMYAVVVLTSNIEEEKTLRISVSARVPQRIELTPMVMSYYKPVQLPPNRDYVSLSFWVNNHGATPVEVLEASVDDPAIRTKIEPQTPGKKIRIEVQVPYQVEIPQQGRKLTVKTDDPEFPEVSSKIIAPAKAQSNLQLPPSVANRVTTRPAQTQPAQTRPAPPPPALALRGQSIPEFNTRTLEGLDLSSDGLYGQITVLNYVSPQCPFCRRQLAQMEQVRAAYQDRGVRFVNIANPNPTGKRLFSNDEVIQALADMGSRLEIAVDADRSLGRLLKATKYPTMFVIDKEGIIVSVIIGSKRNQFELVSAQLDAVMAGKPVPTTLPASAPVVKSSSNDNVGGG